MSESLPNCEKVFMGLTAYGDPFMLDFFDLYNQSPREVISPNMSISGLVGEGKSTFVKLFIDAQLYFKRHVLIQTLKPEYGALVEAWKGTIIQPKPGQRGKGQTTFNPIDPRFSPPEKQELLKIILSIKLGREIDQLEEAALFVALDETLADNSTNPTIHHLCERLFQPTQEAAKRIHQKQETVSEWGKNIAAALFNLANSDLAGVIDQPTNANLRNRLVVIDLYYLSRSGVGRPILSSIMTALLNHSAKHKDPDIPRFDITVREEIWSELHHLKYALAAQEDLKLVRETGRANIFVLHRFSDLEAAGGGGSHQVNIAKGLLAECGTHVIFRPHSREIKQTQELLDLNEIQTENVKRLLPYRSLVKMRSQFGDRSWVVGQIVNSKRKRRIIDTDTAMLKAPQNNEELQEWRDRDNWVHEPSEFKRIQRAEADEDSLV